MYSIGAVLLRVRCIILERERHADWIKHLAEAST
jgi:heme exporter protein C